MQRAAGGRACGSRTSSCSGTTAGVCVLPGFQFLWPSSSVLPILHTVPQAISYVIFSGVSEGGGGGILVSRGGGMRR